MRYTLENGTLQPVKKVTYNGVDYTNPQDELIDNLGLGYPLIEDSQPSYDAALYNLIPVYVQEPAVIRLTWETVPKTAEERVALIDEEIARINADYEAWKNLPIEYEGKGYLPRWISEVYTPMRTLDPAAFPMMVSAVDFSAKSFTKAEFDALYEYLLMVSAAYIGEVNSQIAALEAAKKEIK